MGGGAAGGAPSKRTCFVEGVRAREDSRVDCEAFEAAAFLGGILTVIVENATSIEYIQNVES